MSLVGTRLLTLDKDTLTVIGSYVERFVVGFVSQPKHQSGSRRLTDFLEAQTILAGILKR